MDFYFKNIVISYKITTFAHAKHELGIVFALNKNVNQTSNFQTR